MERDEAVNLLVNDCVSDPPLSPLEAATLWGQFRGRAEALPERQAAEPAHSPLTHEEHQHAQKFMAFLKSIGVTDIQKVVKIDPMRLVVFQYYAITEKGTALLQNYRKNHPPQE